MNFDLYRHLKKLVRHTESFSEFINEVAKWPRRFGVPCWNKANYEWFYNRIQGGATYQTLFTTRA